MHAGSRSAGRLQVALDDKQALLDGWLRCVQRRDERNGRVLSREVKARLEAEKKADGSHGRLAWTLHELVRRAYRGVEDCVAEEKALMARVAKLKCDKAAAERQQEEELAQAEVGFTAREEELGGGMREVSGKLGVCLLYTSPSPRDVEESRMPSSA